MTRWARFSIGGIGGLLPVLASFLAVDLTAFAAIVDRPNSVSLGLCVGYALRILVLFTLGGAMAVLNTEIQSPLALVQIGIAAPALLTSFVSGAAINQNQRPTRQALSLIISSASAEEPKPYPSLQHVQFLPDVLRGLTPGLGVQQPRKLSGPETVSVLVGNTAHVLGRFGPNTTTIHYNRDGTIDWTSPDGRDSGTWRVTDDGLFCTKYRNLRNGAETCQNLWQTGPDAFEFRLPNGTVMGKGSITPGVQ